MILCIKWPTVTSRSFWFNFLQHNFYDLQQFCFSKWWWTAALAELYHPNGLHFVFGQTLGSHVLILHTEPLYNNTTNVHLCHLYQCVSMLYNRWWHNEVLLTVWLCWERFSTGFPIPWTININHCLFFPLRMVNPRYIE